MTRSLSLAITNLFNGRDRRRKQFIVLQYDTTKVQEGGRDHDSFTSCCTLPFSLRTSPDCRSVVSGVKQVWETETPTRNLLGGIAGEGSLQVLGGASNTILRTLNIALSLGLLVFDIALGLTLLARRLERLEAGQVANQILRLSESVVDAARHLAVNESNVSVGDDRTVGGGWGDGDEPWIRRHC